MEFFVENWIWFLVAGIIILMTLIGYIAEKTDFGRKNIPSKEKNKNQDKEEIDTLEIEEPDIKPEVQMSLATDSILSEEPETLEINVEPTIADEIPEELKVPFGDVSFEEPTVQMTENMENKIEDESLVEEVVAEEPTEELKLDDVQTPDVELPDLEKIISEEEDDDVWKF